VLLRNDAIACIDHAYTMLRQHVSQHGDGPIPQNLAGLDFRFRSVEFSISTSMPPPWPLESALSYTDALAITAAFALKMGREGFHWWLVEVVSTEGAGYVGDAHILSGYDFS